MRCKQGERAIIVGATYAKDHIGKIITCVKLIQFNGSPAWLIDPVLPNPKGVIDYWAIFDRNLRPIRDPGDDAQDETLIWKDVPKTEDVWPDPATMQWDDTDKTWTP